MKDFDKKVQTQGRKGQPLEGQLHKWTNPLKGWQPRWFVVDLQQSVLHYYTVSSLVYRDTAVVGSSEL